MKFLGEIQKIPCIDFSAYHNAMRNMPHAMHLESDFEIDGCFDVTALVYGKFDKSFCSGQSPLHVTEDGEIETQGAMQLSFELLERLKNDGETQEGHLAIIKKELGSDER